MQVKVGQIWQYDGSYGWNYPSVVVHIKSICNKINVVFENGSFAYLNDTQEFKHPMNWKYIGQSNYRICVKCQKFCHQMCIKDKHG